MSVARIVITDDNALAREGLSAMLDRSGRFDVVGEAESGEEALALCEKHRPDLALLDIRYRTRGCEAGIDGLEAARRLSDTQPEIAIITLTVHDNADYLRAATAAGARGFITKDASREELLKAIDLVAAGGVAYPPTLMRRAVVAGGRSPVLAALERLTPREREVLDALASGATNKEIAIALGSTPGTVKTHIERLIGKLGVRDRTQAAVIAVEHRGGWSA